MGTGRIDTENIINLILDLGGVVLELDVQKTISAFRKLGFPQLENADIILSKYPFFHDFEIGKISSDDFIERVSEISGKKISREKVLEAWNAMLIGFKREKVDLLLKLRRKYRLFLLSNTNAIHAIHYNNQLKEAHGIANLEEIFEKVWYSHVLNLRKPDPEIFEYVLKQEELLPQECLYIDDTSEHVETARSLGFQAYHLSPPEQITDIL